LPKGRATTDQPHPVELGAQSDLIGAPEPMSIKAVLAAPNGGSRAHVTDQSSHLA
jgi:hypothetical protein